MAWDIRSTYFYLVCFATLLMVIIGTVQVVQHSLDLVLPAETYRPSVLDMEMRYRGRAGEAEPSAYTREELEAMAAEEEARMRQQQRRGNLRGLLGSLALVLIAAPVYVYHWRRVREPH